MDLRNATEEMLAGFDGYLHVSVKAREKARSAFN